MNDKKAKNSKGKIILFCVIGMIIIAAFKSIGEDDDYRQNSTEYKNACETAELAVQSKKVGHSCSADSKVIYSNDRYIVVAVKYWLSEETKDTYWLTFVRCYQNGEYWNSMIDGNGIDYDNIPNEIVDELKVKWELK